MDGQHPDRIAAAPGASRRRLLRALGAGLAGATLAPLAGGGAAAQTGGSGGGWRPKAVRSLPWWRRLLRLWG